MEAREVSMWCILSVLSTLAVFIGVLYYLNWKYCRNLPSIWRDNDGLH